MRLQVMSSSETPNVVLVTSVWQGVLHVIFPKIHGNGHIVNVMFHRLETIQGFHPNTIRTMALDVTKYEGINAVVHKMLEEHGKIDIVVNNVSELAMGTYCCHFILPLGRCMYAQRAGS
ncbi:hypothetical protein EDC04DRAFT_1938581 [Pisolithus marmoratus]|nr:hypothetical protein EDC04DRAFT_1938581 [Pisolithus marmoratus]